MLQTKDVELLLVHAALQVQYQKPEQAITLLDAVLEIEPHHQGARQTLAVACLHSGRYTRAAELCESLLQTEDSNQTGLWFCLSQARWKQHDVEGARRAHRRYLQSINSESNE
ncbi:type III secretion system chaperone VscY [Vibrio sp. AND4]|uniref:type III secretion system chaperone VscY n=1 Tax=Vibrio sp. AND4 TaxID=314289 RepID=UPI00015F0E9C|nr:type III secretion system chaperone VscY [Vibrio sp. AND4]EDP58949.1 putative YscY [Vibrio sp. AND4]